jgi:hypothetical protein
MKITITPSRKPEIGEAAGAAYTTVTIEHPYDDLNVEEAVAVMKSALVAWGFSEKLFEKAVEELE